jgi:hypothetical protein
MAAIILEAIVKLAVKQGLTNSNKKINSGDKARLSGECAVTDMV